MIIVMVMLMWLSAGFTTSSLSSADSLPSNMPRATWLWDTSLIGTNAGRTDILQFAKNERVERIYLQVNRDVAQSDYRSFIQAAADSGIQIHALDGAPKWALPENRKYMTALVDWVKSYNASVLVNERFAGIQVDIEPYLLPDWTADQHAVAVNWQQSIAYFHDLVKKDSAALTTSAALPFWLDGIPLSDGSGTLSEAMMGKLDETALMTYRNQALDVIDLAAEEIALADRLGKKVWISVETNPAPDTPYITFSGESKAEMERQLAVIDGLLKARPSYSGIAVHDYTGWRHIRN
ncbi:MULTISPECIES: hypothetical protein [Paenibacillus]|uniref:Amidase n=1 Tax=Paenibacillus validus TaxID=44253 RepID=A0A7X2Z8P2_9BACL|nr:MULTISPECIES: hypothetical protein [Paenibacillus]MUG70296.1 hypothetical protein [Paenibacillus validus]